MTDRIEAALAALDKATPGPWGNPYWDNFPGDRGWWIHNGLEGANEYAVAVTFEGNPKDEFDATLIAAAPDLAAEVIRLRKWQDDAFCHVEISRNYLSTELKTMKDDGSGAIDQLKQLKDEADRLIVEAEGE